MTKTVNGYAAGLYNSANNEHQAIAIHDTESSSAAGSFAYMKRTQAGSYQDLVDLNGDVYLMVPENKQAWAAMGTGNRKCLHLCATGYASWSRAKWLSYPAMIDSMAVIAAKWIVRYGIPARWINGTQLRNGGKGLCGHADISLAWRETDHTDPGSNFPKDVLLQRIQRILEGDLDDALIIAYNKVVYTPISVGVKDIREQITGSRDAGENKGWPQLGNRTLPDGISVVLQELSTKGSSK